MTSDLDPRTRVILWVSLALMPLVYWTVWRALTGPFQPEVQAMVISAVVSGTLGTLVGYWLGGSAVQQRQAAPPVQPPAAGPGA